MQIPLDPGSREVSWFKGRQKVCHDHIRRMSCRVHEGVWCGWSISMKCGWVQVKRISGAEEDNLPNLGWEFYLLNFNSDHLNSIDTPSNSIPSIASLNSIHTILNPPRVQFLLLSTTILIDWWPLPEFVLSKSSQMGQKQVPLQVYPSCSI